MTSAVATWRITMLVTGGLLLVASVYVQRHRRSYGPFVHLIAGFAFAGGAAALGAIG